MTAARPYRFGFVLTTAAGNMTRYLNLRKYAERDAEVECVWAPIKHFIEPDPFPYLPGPLHTRAIVMREAAPVIDEIDTMDGIMLHAFEPYVISVLRTYTRRSPLLFWSADNPPISDPKRYPQYGGNHARSEWRQRLRFRFDTWCASRVSDFFPFSAWAGNILVQDCKIPQDRVHPIHVGLDLELWPHVPLTITPKKRPAILFVGGDFVRKGGDLLLKVFLTRFANRADLHLVTKEPPADLPSSVFTHTHLGPNDPRLQQLYTDADLFVLPTRADVSSWVALEAMATGRPVITSRIGGIPDIVHEGESGFLIDPDDASALADRLETLICNPIVRYEMGERGRKIVERDFSAAVCVPQILRIMKASVDANRP